MKQQPDVSPVVTEADIPAEDLVEPIPQAAAKSASAETAKDRVEPRPQASAKTVPAKPAADPKVELAAAEPDPVVIKIDEPAPKLRKKAAAPKPRPSEQNMNRAATKDYFGEGTPFAISVDGETLVSSTEVDSERKTDVGLAGADIQVKYDGLDITQVLNASHETGANGDVRLLGHLNYPDFVSKAEFRVYRMKNGEIADLVDDRSCRSWISGQLCRRQDRSETSCHTCCASMTRKAALTKPA